MLFGLFDYARKIQTEALPVSDRFRIVTLVHPKASCPNEAVDVRYT
jgi:hypothetical protein